MWMKAVKMEDVVTKSNHKGIRWFKAFNSQQVDKIRIQNRYRNANFSCTIQKHFWELRIQNRIQVDKFVFKTVFSELVRFQKHFWELRCFWGCSRYIAGLPWLNHERIAPSSGNNRELRELALSGSESLPLTSESGWSGSYQTKYLEGDASIFC